MKKIILLTLFSSIIFLISCGPQDNSAKNVALIDKFVEAVEAMDHATMENLLSEGYIGVGPSYGDSIDKALAVESWKYNVENLYKKIEYNRSRNIAVHIPDGDNKGEWVSNWAELHIIYKGEDQAAVTIFANTLYQIENDKIIKSYTLYNEADALEQLGYYFY